MKKLTFLQRTLMPLSLAFVLLITFIVGAFPKKEAIPVSADESNTVHYFSNSAPTYSYSTIARRYQYSEIDYVDTLDGLDLIVLTYGLKLLILWGITTLST